MLLTDILHANFMENFTMSTINAIKDYILRSDFAPSKGFSINEKKVKELDQPYQFNFLEKTGNALLIPMRWAITEFDKTDSVARKTGLVVLEICVSMITLIGAGIKRLGEVFNDRKVRQVAMSKLDEISETFKAKTGAELKNVYTVFDDLRTLKAAAMLPVLNDINDTFNENVIKNNHKASDEEFAVLMDSSAHKPEIRHSDHFVEIFQLKNRWNARWNDFAVNALECRDNSSTYDAIVNLAENDPQTMEKVDQLIHSIREKTRIQENIEMLAKEYNQTIGCQIA
jgi:hypothetical protein